MGSSLMVTNTGDYPDEEIVQLMLETE